LLLSELLLKLNELLRASSLIEVSLALSSIFDASSLEAPIIVIIEFRDGVSVRPDLDETD